LGKEYLVSGEKIIFQHFNIFNEQEGQRQQKLLRNTHIRKLSVEQE